MAKDITTLARTEGLEAHARAIEVRFENNCMDGNALKGLNIMIRG